MEKKITEKIDVTRLKYYNDKGEKKYNIDRIMTYLYNREGKGLVRDICSLLGEERVLLLNLERLIREHILNTRKG